MNSPPTVLQAQEQQELSSRTPFLPRTLAASPGFCLRQLRRSQIPSVGHVSARAGAAVAVSRAGPSLPFPSLAGGEQSHKNSKSPVWEARRARLVAVRIMRNIWSEWWEQLGAGCQGGRCAPGTGTAGMDPSLPGATGPPVPAGACQFTFPCSQKPCKLDRMGRASAVPLQLTLEQIPVMSMDLHSWSPALGGLGCRGGKGAFFALFNCSFANKGQGTPNSNMCWQCWCCQTCQHRANPSGAG